MQSASALTFDEMQQLSYKEVKGSGRAALCPTVDMPSIDVKDMKPGSYQMVRFCMEPTSFEIKEEGKGAAEWVPSKLLTRLTYTLSEMSGKLDVAKDGQLHLKEEEGGFDFNVVTVKVPKGEEFPLMFSIKDLDVKGTPDGMEGSFKVPGYRGTSFMDPRGRGPATGYDAFQGLQAAESGDPEDLARQNRKRIAVTDGAAQFAVAQVNDLGEIGGVFQTVQQTSDDMGARDPAEVRVSGIWYAQLE
ncbi:hypothetical protein N2152v2_004144 [Parachlorella kessleri]